jgi:SAM-dependent methyltransferase
MSDPAYGESGEGTRTLELLEAAERYNRWLFSWIEPHLGELNVEIGAGRGTLTNFALERHRVIATEPSRTGRSEIESRFADHPRLAGVLPNFFDVNTDGGVDCVYSANVLEHVPDDLGMLAHAALVLRPGGRFVAVVPAGAWLYSPFDAAVGHHRRYTRADRTRLAVGLEERKVPLRIKSYTPKNPVGALGWLLKMRILGARAVDPNDVQKVEFLVPLLRLLDPLPLPFGQNLVMVLEKHGT